MKKKKRMGMIKKTSNSESNIRFIKKGRLQAIESSVKSSGEKSRAIQSKDGVTLEVD